jgi:hypothetical protein
MIGRQVLLTNRPFTLEELHEFMKEHWDAQEAGRFVLGRPTKASIEEYILLPATQRFMTIVYPRKAGGLFSRENKVILSTADTPAGALEGIGQTVPTGNIFIGIAQMKSLISSEKERKGPAEEVLQRYTAYMRKILGEAGYLKE